MQNKNHDFDKPYVQEIDSPQSYESLIKIYRFFTVQKLIILIVVVFGLKYAYDHRTEQVKETGVIIYHGRDQVFYQGTTLYYRYKHGDLKLYHKRSDLEEENESYLQFQAWLTGSLREIRGSDFVPLADFDYHTVASAFIVPPDPNSMKFTAVIALPFFWTTLFGFLLIVEPRVALVLYTPIALLPARGTGFGSIPRYDPDVNYKLGGQVLLLISFFLFLPLFPSFMRILRGLW